MLETFLNYLLVEYKIALDYPTIFKIIVEIERVFIHHNFFLRHSLLLFHFRDTLSIIFPLWFLFNFVILFFHDLLAYMIGWLLWSLPFLNKLKYNNKKLFYIYGKMIPFLWSFSVFLGAFLSDGPQVKRDFKLMSIGNIVFLIYAVIFGILYAMYTGEWYTFC